MIKENLLVYVLFKRNYVDYGDNLEFKNIMFDSWNVFDKKKTMKFIYIVRNYFGEPLAYYFLWLTDFIKWHLFPSIIGILFFFAFVVFFFPFFPFNPQPLDKQKIRRKRKSDRREGN